MRRRPIVIGAGAAGISGLEIVTCFLCRNEGRRVVACCAPEGFLKLKRAEISSKEGRTLPLLKAKAGRLSFNWTADLGSRKSTCSVQGWDVIHSSSKCSYMARGETRPGEGRE